MSIKTRKFDVTEWLENDEDIQGFLEAAAEDWDTSHFIQALNTAARARGMTQLAEDAGVARPSLYRSLSGEGKPEFDTITKVLKALGCRFSVVSDTPSVSETVEAVETVADDRTTVCR